MPSTRKRYQKVLDDIESETARYTEELMNDKTKFCASLPWEEDITWLDLTGIIVMDEDRRAKVELSTRGVCGEYPGFLVTVLSKRTGTIDSKFFRFDDYLDRKADRADGRKDYPLGKNTCFHVVSHCGWDWYIAKPRDARPFTEAVESYVGAFA